MAIRGILCREPILYSQLSPKMESFTNQLMSLIHLQPILQIISSLSVRPPLLQPLAVFIRHPQRNLPHLHLSINVMHHNPNIRKPTCPLGTAHRPVAFVFR
jgi:hypothetical protein